jgi:hypothetical protein
MTGPTFKVMAVKGVRGADGTTRTLYGVGAVIFPVIAERSSFEHAAELAKALNATMAEVLARQAAVSDDHKTEGV